MIPDNQRKAVRGIAAGSFVGTPTLSRESLGPAVYQPPVIESQG
ncbi:hypothetical protein [Acidicapsa acidisoli]|nr:hypothetical protein [Acidicapsa acidisoli]